MNRLMMAVGLLFAASLCDAGFAQKEANPGQVEIKVIDKTTGELIACRVHIKDGAGKPQRHPQLPFWNDHFVCAGTASLDLPAGKYSIEVEHGPEFTLHSDSFTLEGGNTKKLAIELQRLTDLPAEGWYPGDLHVPRAVSDIELLMKAEELHVAPVITW